MKQQINLAPAKLKNQGDWPSGRLMMLLTILVCLLMLVIGIVDGRQLYLVYGEFNIHAQKHSQLQIKIKALENEAALPKVDATLDGKINALEERFVPKDRLRNALKGDLFGETSGYSDLFIALARQSVPGVWLTHLVISGSGVNIKMTGQTRSAELVPLYLEKLSNENSFSGTQFNNFKIKKADVIGDSPSCCIFTVESGNL